jgi:hypothetical protein
MRQLIDRTRAELAKPEPQGLELVYRYCPVTIAECGGPCEQGPEYCDCGEIKGEAPSQPEQLVSEHRPVWTEGICGDGAAILKDGVMQPIEDVLAALNATALAQPEPEGLPPRVGHILRLAEIIREVDGNHDKGAGALAEAILSHPGSRWRTRAELAKPEPEGGGSIHGLEGEIVATIRAYASVEPQVGASRILHESGFGVVARAVLARYARLAIEPVPVSERLPGAEDCDELGQCWWWRDGEVAWFFCDANHLNFPLWTHWLPHYALPVPPEPGVADHVTDDEGTRWDRTTDAALWAKAFCLICPEMASREDVMIGWFANAIMAGWDHHGWKIDAERKPIPVSERLPGAEDCDAEGRCWLHSPHLLGGEAAWVYDCPAWAQRFWAQRFTAVYSHWLPHYALPVPTSQESP